MFERYTEKARRAIFFARYEASQFGSPYIEAEYLLLGLVRADHELAKRLRQSGGSSEAIHKQIEARTPVREKVSTSFDLPLSQECKRVLQFAAEEAIRLEHRHIDTEHLLLGLLGQEKSFAAAILRQYGLSLTGAREEAARASAWQAEAAEPQSQEWLRQILRTVEMKVWFRQFHWEERQCAPQDALRHRATSRVTLYRGQSYNPADFELVKAGWTYDHCAVCWNALFDADDPEQSIGYTNGQDWLCEDCYAIVSQVQGGT